ncbi:type VII secretion-associated serine protease mycosin [Actinacidiphila bryophytorum]|uniref:Type VII secretion-associated serine protease mycosin n=1 Tax=Actinacidiphila bryophytorum TaxID=1436133 RepID=A0A9W4GWV1_9ACTN|nr:type VII secretion-associated serine protease mycosin [Actinacidiphila bryophytorum]MBM9435626.1 type VII secretion-associated serine protease mycosin [Actinacidiphila bryophytorum]MBN6543312.1 type VII secretion-associated serine protease mycosin [Actinacidiphila bryophytorum]CAG7610141.1 Type VII secretion-associated serine protease mycosin [Actinacidiphila bryophytorum]
MKRRARTWVQRALAVSAVSGALMLSIGALPAQAQTLRQMQWHIDAMRLPEAWKISKGAGITVAVIDTGVDRTIPDLQGQVLAGTSFTYPVSSPYKDKDGHGTGMSSLIAGTGAAEGGSGAIGAAPAAKILPIQVFNDPRDTNEAASAESFTLELDKALRYAADSQARVINISQGVPASSLRPEDIAGLQSAVDYARDKGKLIFAATGNSGEKGSPVAYPAASRGVVGVGALDRNGNALTLSTKGPQVDISAVGDNISKACPSGIRPNCVNTSSGTSDASALTSGSAALVWSAHPAWTANQVLRVLLNTASKPTDGAERNDAIGYGAVRPRVALQTPGDPGPADVYPLAEHEGWKQGADVSATPTDGAEGTGAPAPSASSSASDSDKSAAAASDSGGGGGSSTPWIAAGAAVVVLAAAGTALALRGRRRRAAAAAPAFVAQPLQPQQPPQQPPPYGGYRPPPPPPPY